MSFICQSTAHETRALLQMYVRKNNGMTSGSGDACPSCKGTHGLLECRDFKKRSHEERIEILRRNRICDNCFLKGHFAVGCAERAACTVDGCRRKHQSIIHPYSRSSRDNNTSSIAHANSNECTQCYVIGAGDSGHSHGVTANEMRVLKIVTVKVKGRGRDEVVETYALLDSGSDVSLCDRKLVEQLGVSGVERSFLMTTQKKKDSSKIGLKLDLQSKILMAKVDSASLGSGRLIPSTFPNAISHTRMTSTSGLICGT